MSARAALPAEQRKAPTSAEKHLASSPQQLSPQQRATPRISSSSPGNDSTITEAPLSPRPVSSQGQAPLSLQASPGPLSMQGERLRRRLASTGVWGDESARTNSPRSSLGSAATRMLDDPRPVSEHLVYGGSPSEQMQYSPSRGLVQSSSATSNPGVHEKFREVYEQAQAREVQRVMDFLRSPKGVAYLQRRAAAHCDGVNVDASLVPDAAGRKIVEELLAETRHIIAERAWRDIGQSPSTLPPHYPSLVGTPTPRGAA